MKQFFLIPTLSLLTVFCFSKVKLPPIFGNNMILQQETHNAIWGVADAGEEITIKADWGVTASTIADKNGDWKIMLKTPSFGTGHSLTIVGKNTITIKNIAIGEVWLCAGQSNMGWALGRTFGGEEEAALANFPDFRIFKSAREHWQEPLKFPRDRLAKWSVCTPESASATSAVSYYFGKKLHQELGIPVGIIVQAYAGTPIEGWMPKEIQVDDPRTIEIIKELEEISNKQSNKEDALKKFYQELDEYNAKIDAGEIMLNKVKELKPPFITKPANMGHQYPSHIFNAMIHPVRPYGIRGAIWYQGERNAKEAPQAANYEKQLTLMINYYRSSWHKLSKGYVDKDFPFFFTQLPSYCPKQADPVEHFSVSPWPVNRESMRMVDQKVTNTGMVVSIDVGDVISLHPRNKKPIGLRHAYLALAKVYQKDIVAYGPMYKSSRIEENRIIINYDYIGSGLMAGKKGNLNAFAIAGADKRWHWAEAKIVGNTVIVSSKDVPKPVAVRYAWAMNPSQRNLLYNKEGIPASPFRTDDWKIYDDNEESGFKKPEKPQGYEIIDWKRPNMTQ